MAEETEERVYTPRVDGGPWDVELDDIPESGGRHRLERLQTVSLECEIPARVTRVGLDAREGSSTVNSAYFGYSEHVGMAVSVHAVPADGVDRWSPEDSGLLDMHQGNEVEYTAERREGIMGEEFVIRGGNSECVICTHVAPPGYRWAMTVAAWNNNGSVSEQLMEDVYNTFATAVITRGDRPIPPGASLSLALTGAAMEKHRAQIAQQHTGLSAAAGR